MAEVTPAPCMRALFPLYLQLVDPLLGIAGCQRLRDLYREALRASVMSANAPGGQNNLHSDTYNNNSSTD
ncbi:MAG: hypothetical protein QOE55_4590 [Acidobacteriaceae bacterium]|jgi:hypothetical protein|nr:hypothetical protein [Acidobacteriaceae bacterium]